jgi:CHASE3 domain sensor protein
VGATLNGETAQRGYFITYDKRYLAPYWRGQKAYETEIARVRSSLGAEATQQQTELVDEIERLGDAKWAEMGATVTLVARGEIAAAHARILSDEGQLAMDGCARRSDAWRRWSARGWRTPATAPRAPKRGSCRCCRCCSR